VPGSRPRGLRGGQWQLAPAEPEAPFPPQHTPLGAPGLYIQTLLPGSPAAADGRLSLGDRILEVNGCSLMGVSYLRYQGPAGGPSPEQEGTGLHGG
jgi:S1-C subfamily serine protease